MDASSVVAYLFRNPTGVHLSEALTRGDELHVPALCDLEFASAVRGAEARGAADEHRIAEALSDYLALPLERHPHVALLPRIVELGGNLTPYDAAYVALAEQLEAAFLTDDLALARAIRSDSRIRVALA